MVPWQQHYSSLIVCAMLLQEYEGRIAALGVRLEEEQEAKAAAAEVSAS